LLEEKQITYKVTELYEEYSSKIFKYILKMTQNVQVAEDLTHDTFLKVFYYLKSGNEIDYPKTFIYRTARNVTVDSLRKKKPFHLLKDLFNQRSQSSVSTEYVVQFREDAREILNLLSQLKTDFREVIILRKIEGFSIQETAKILGWSESKVKTTLFRALRELEAKQEKGGIVNEIS